jgi:signal-transduction protein with cAMP-binding, CBS, and nucleotidyltransferase domain
MTQQTNKIMESGLELKVSLSMKDIEAIFVTAIEGGSNYWYLLKEDSIESIRLYVTKEENPYLSEAFGQAVMKGASVAVYDLEDEDELLGIVTKESIIEGLQKALEDKRDEVSKVLNEDYDAGDADVLFQYMVLGEIVYG